MTTRASASVLENTEAEVKCKLFMQAYPVG